MQLLWFLDSSNPGRHSQATPPLGVSLQMWAQPWSLFMQLMPSAKQDKCKSISILSISAGKSQIKVSSIHTQTTACYFWEVSTVLGQKYKLTDRKGRKSNPANSMAPRFLHLWSFLCPCSLTARSKSSIPRFVQHLHSHPMLSLYTNVYKTSSFLL